MFMEKDVLSGIRILDFSRVLAGPYATRTLGDFGAEVIKVQSRKTATGTESNDVPYFVAWNRNKRSITLNLDLPESREIALKLVGICDVVVENFSPRVMFNWGLNYERLLEVKKDLVMVSMSGMGQTGPWKDYVAYGPTVQSLGGLTYLTAYDQDLPVGLGHSYADVISGLYCTVAVLSALEYRSRSGLGQYVDVSEYEAVCTLLGPVLMDVAVNQADPFPVGNRSPDIPAAPYGCYRCSGDDRWCVIAVFSENEWHALCAVASHPEWISDERFRTAAARKKNEKELDSQIQQWTSRCEAERIMQALQEAGVAAGVVQTAEDLARDPQLKAREFFVPSFHPALGATFMDRTPIRMAAGSPQNWSAAPSLGADNRYVFLELLGLSESEFQAYTEKGVFS
jgi:crotonobetainyl-CoA:carnitine CoA-transferase CaiB-like acyl-CoA transferase